MDPFISSQLNGRHTHTSLLSVEWEAHTHLSQSTAHSTPKATHTQSVAFTASTANYLYNTILMAWLCLLLEASPSILETHIYGWSPLAVHMPHLPPGRQLCHPGSGTIPAVDQSNSQWRQQSVEATVSGGNTERHFKNACAHTHIFCTVCYHRYYTRYIY